MKKTLVKALFATFAATVLAVGAYAQGQMVKVSGTCHDVSGQPIVGGIVELHNNNSGTNMKLKTGKKGDYLTIGAQAGDYNVTLYSAEGVKIYAFSHVPFVTSQDNVVDFDLKKEAARGGGVASAEQVKKHQEEVKQAEKIKGLNGKLQEAAAARQAKDFQKAIDLIKPETEAAPKIHQLWGDLGVSYSGAKLYAEAIEAFKKAIEIDDTNAEYHNNLGSAYAHANDFESAMKEFEQAATLAPENAGLYYFNEGVLLVNKGQMDGALAAMEKAIAADPTKADPYYWKGMALFGKATLGKDNAMIAPAGTAEAFNKYLELDPSGRWAETAKQSLQMIGAKVDNSFGKQKKGKK